ncbi:sigma factor-like helix-turn-helix DNA-binding protein [Paraburkholderia sp. BR10923]
MRQIREVLRLRFVCERSQREIATTIGVSSATVWDYLDRARRAQLDFGKAKSMDDARQPEVRRTQGRLLRSGS